ncbi:MAG: NUDIX hydrolase [Gammaproteobacteria bacterium]|nr:NUDIX hydrolase [Gammaproteobacteria bacterium]MDH5801005.1 NUDIX hydrolase [Gammaproteobacteria bacterium]
MKFCSDCGADVSFKVPDGDNLPRYICQNCGLIHYQNPKIVTGCIPEWEDKILLCKRAIEPRYGLWTLPAGFMENQESTDAAAARETLEEANARVLRLRLYAVYNIPRIDQVYILFRGQLQDLDFSPGSESLDTRLFTHDQIPWDELAFPVMTETLKRYYQDRDSGSLTNLNGGSTGHTHFGSILDLR